MGSDKYRLKWSKYQDNILSTFQSLLETEQLSDVTLFCEGTTFKAHRVVLAACSTHFQTLFSNAPQNGTNTQLFIILDGTRAEDLQVLLQFMYRGEAYLQQHRIDSVLQTATLLKIKGLCEKPENHDSHDSGSIRNLNTGASNARWAHSPDPIPHRSSVGIMGNMTRSIRREPREHNRAPPQDYRDLITGRIEMDQEPPERTVRPMSPPPEHFAFPTSRSSNDTFGVYGISGFSRGSSLTSRDYSDRVRSPVRDRSPVPRNRGNYGSTSSTPIPVVKEDRDAEFYDHRGGGGSRSGSVGHHDRATPMSDKASDRHTPASAHDRDREYEARGSRNSPTSPIATSSKFPSDSTSDYVKAASSSTFKDRVRRSSDSATVTQATGIGIDNNDTESSERHIKLPLPDFRSRDGDFTRDRSPSGRSITDIKIDVEARAKQLEAFRQIAQAHQAEQQQREPFLRTAAGVLHGGINAASIANQSLQGASASDLMRMAVTIRDPDNGDQISGSGSKLKCPFCERTYGYETNLRAHIRQRHQGIRVACPHCPRTFTRNNTVRRHCAREHAHLVNRVATKFPSTRVMPDPIRLGQLTMGATSPAVLPRVLPGTPRGDEDNNGGESPPTTPASTSTSAP